MIQNITKQGALIIFSLSDGTSVKYDLSKNITIGKRGQPVKGLSSQLSGVDLWQCEQLFEDKSYFKFLKAVANMVNCRTLAGTLKHVREYSNLESFYRIGIEVFRTSLRVSDLPKDMLRYTMEYTGTKCSLVNQKAIKIWKERHDIIQSVLSCRNEDTKKNIDLIVANILTNTYMNYNVGKFENNFIKLIVYHNYDSKALTNYLLKIDEYEGVNVNTATTELYDYVQMQIKMRNERYEKYPRCLLTTHAIAVRNYNRLKEVYDQEAFAATYDQSLEATIGMYKFICPKSPDEIKDEAFQQQHCVASYIDRVIDGKCHIIFMRRKHDTDHSLITLEVKNNRVVQKRGRLNRSTTMEENMVIAKYESKLNKSMCAA